MLAQIRIYTINSGQMDAFLKQFKEEVLPLHETAKWPVVSSWVNRPQNEFIWIPARKAASVPVAEAMRYE